ncbi:metal-dependent amidase/aminoacylase/carboxypeptidase [Penicillium riverlandense]|uniref:metal-dependent amidase/aminoacylase/carboxypeptidase n=1 Tax=Penicillium riverlandense TaxID=1903569 RepID=UPI00254972B0|nr:metal-dependent amidase/aminoacylase/carboxypeptidase [Penicillium riverlandense]KAJ5815513.1 metal-dependent amidase/aminoacylase/carboxypeptidase [Penicillium riverlandense]
MTQSSTDADVQLTIDKGIEELGPELRELSIKIHDNPELGYCEHKAHDNVAAFLTSQGFNVTKHAHGLETSLSAEYGSGGRVVNFNCEYDALPGIGHACGHNLIAMGSVAGFIGTVAALKKYQIPGRVRLLGTPAEEGLGGKIKLLNAGAYKDVDASLMAHPMSASVMSTPTGFSKGIPFGTCVASIKVKATFTGKPAHGALLPHEGINALDAAVMAYNGIGLLRQQIKPYERIGIVILEGGEAPNVITPQSVLNYNLRSKTIKEARELNERAKRCFEGAAISTGCKVNFELTNEYSDLRPSRALSAVYLAAMEKLDIPQYDNLNEVAPWLGSYSTDMGNVTQACPGIHPCYWIPTDERVVNHTPEFTAAARTEESHQLTFATSKAMAATAFKVLSDDAFAKEVRNEFENTMR